MSQIRLRILGDVHKLITKQRFLLFWLSSAANASFNITDTFNWSASLYNVYKLLAAYHTMCGVSDVSLRRLCLVVLLYVCAYYCWFICQYFVLCGMQGMLGDLAFPLSCVRQLTPTGWKNVLHLSDINETSHWPVSGTCRVMLIRVYYPDDESAYPTCHSSILW